MTSETSLRMIEDGEITSFENEPCCWCCQKLQQSFQPQSHNCRRLLRCRQRERRYLSRKEKPRKQRIQRYKRSKRPSVCPRTCMCSRCMLAFKSVRKRPGKQREKLKKYPPPAFPIIPRPLPEPIPPYGPPPPPRPQPPPRPPPLRPRPFRPIFPPPIPAPRPRPMRPKFPAPVPNPCVPRRPLPWPEPQPQPRPTKPPGPPGWPRPWTRPWRRRWFTKDNGFFRFFKMFRKKNPRINSITAARKATRIWCKMSEDEREKFSKQRSQ